MDPKSKKPQAFCDSPSAYLDIEVSADNRVALASTMDGSFTSRRVIMEDSIGDNAKKRMAKRKITWGCGIEMRGFK